MPSKKVLWLVLTLSICLGLSACKVIPSPCGKPIAYCDSVPSGPTEKAGEKAALAPNLPSIDRYNVMAVAPAYIANISSLGCSWHGVAGQVFNDAGAPVMNLTVVVGGTIDGQEISSSGTTGVSKAYGPGGYEIDLANSPVATTHSLWIELRNSLGKPLSDKFYFDTFNDCQKNLLVINFKDIGESQLVFPVIRR